MERVKKYADEMQKLCIDIDCISRTLFSEFNVKRGLRDEKGKGILLRADEYVTSFYKKD